jgi:hypothetical protein
LEGWFLTTREIAESRTTHKNLIRTALLFKCNGAQVPSSSPSPSSVTQLHVSHTLRVTMLCIMQVLAFTAFALSFVATAIVVCIFCYIPRPLKDITEDDNDSEEWPSNYYKTRYGQHEQVVHPTSWPVDLERAMYYRSILRV